MSIEQPIFPAYGKGQLVATNTTAVSVTVAAGTKQLCLTVVGANPVYFRVTNLTDTSVATTSDALVNAVNRMLISKDADQTRLSVVSPAGASSIHIIPCDGEGTM